MVWIPQNGLRQKEQSLGFSLWTCIISQAPPLVQDPVTDGVVELGRDDRADEVRELILVGRVVDAQLQKHECTGGLWGSAAGTQWRQ